MDVTQKLLKVFRVDQQIRGLQGRLHGAERFLKEQINQLSEIESMRRSIEGQLRQLKASIANLEGETSQIDAHVNELRERMNHAKTNKEYKALLTEVNTFKERRNALEESELEHLTKVEQLEARLAELQEAHAKRIKLRDVAEQDRQKRADEIRDRLEELQQQRAALVADVPADALEIYERLLAERGEDAMAPLEVVDRKRHEYICGSSMMSVPMETAMSLLAGKLTLSPNDGCILYLTEEAANALSSSVAKIRK
ncbi:MAG: C4-type zinc ribbon domain-containing protein [Phycisphaerales bacterium]